VGKLPGSKDAATDYSKSPTVLTLHFIIFLGFSGNFFHTEKYFQSSKKEGFKLIHIFQGNTDAHLV